MTTLKSLVPRRVKHQIIVRRNRLIPQLFDRFERFGVHLTLDHFYEPVPNVRKLPDRVWEPQAELPGLNIDQDKQLALLEKFVETYGQEFKTFPLDRTPDSREYYARNRMFEGVDAEILYCMVRSNKPRRIIEIGSGYSTLVMAKAIQANAADDPPVATELTAIEPYPPSFIEGPFPEVSRLLRSDVQEVPLAEFEALRAGDILFIDSSHVLRIGSDVWYEYLQVLPRLAAGVLVHIHDIFLPAEYPRHWLTEEHHFWTEQYLLQAFLSFNDAFEVVWAAGAMHLSHSDTLRTAFRSYEPEAGSVPSSFWIRRLE